MDFGPAPALGDHVLSLVPAHGASIARAATRTQDTSRPQPPCFAADFSDLPEQAQWFRVVLDGVEVTPRLTWVISESEDTNPRACFATAEGLEPGVHTMTVVVRAPFDSAADPLQTVTWSFRVIP